jgi:hypothetical protein
LVYLKAAAISVLIMCPGTLLKVFVRSKSFLVLLVGLLNRDSYHPKIEIFSLLPFLFVYLLFLSFALLSG